MFKFKVVPKNTCVSFAYKVDGRLVTGIYSGNEVYSVPVDVYAKNPVFAKKVAAGVIAEVKEEPKVKVGREEPMVVSVTAEEPVEEEVKEVRRRGKKKQEAAE